MSKPKNLLGPHPSPKNSTIGPQKFQNDLKKKKIKKSENQKAYKKKLFVNISKAIKTFWTSSQPQS